MIDMIDKTIELFNTLYELSPKTEVDKKNYKLALLQLEFEKRKYLEGLASLEDEAVLYKALSMKIFHAKYEIECYLSTLRELGGVQ